MNPDDVDALVDLGTLCLVLDDLPKAKALLVEAAGLDARANWQLAEYFISIDDPAAAEEKIRLAIAAGEQRAYLDLALLTSGSSPEAEVRTYFEKASDAGAPSAASQFAVYLDGLGHSAEARRVAQAAVDRGDTRSYAPLAVILESQGDLVGARKYYRLAISAGDVEYEDDLRALEP